MEGSKAGDIKVTAISDIDGHIRRNRRLFRAFGMGVALLSGWLLAGGLYALGLFGEPVEHADLMVVAMVLLLGGMIIGLNLAEAQLEVTADKLLPRFEKLKETPMAYSAFAEIYTAQNGRITKQQIGLIELGAQREARELSRKNAEEGIRKGLAETANQGS